MKKTVRYDDSDVQVSGWYFHVQHTIGVSDDTTTLNNFYFDGELYTVYDQIKVAPNICGLEQVFEILREKLRWNLGFEPLLVIDHNLNSLKAYDTYIAERKSLPTYPFPYNTSFRVLIINPERLKTFHRTGRDDEKSLYIHFDLDFKNDDALYITPHALMHKKEYDQLKEYFENKGRYDILIN